MTASAPAADFGASGTGPNAWLPATRRSGSGLPVVCFPPAGAGAGFFRDWSAGLPSSRLVPVQLPGREERFADPALSDAVVIAGHVAEAIECEGWDTVVLLGYSFGALLAFETAMALETTGHCRVASVVACARAAPQDAPLETVADWPDGDLLTYVRDLGGLPPEIEAAPEFIDLLLPVLRADFRANDLYAAPPERMIDAPIVTVAGRNDPATAGGRDGAWASRTRGAHTLELIDGGHFFIIENREATLKVIVDAVARTPEPEGTAP